MPTYGLYLSTLVHEFSGIYVRKLSNINKDLKITEYDAGLVYKLNKSAELSLRYALGTFDESSLEDMQTVVGAVRIDF